MDAVVATAASGASEDQDVPQHVVIKERYANAAKGDACCDADCCGKGGSAYSPDELAALPKGAHLGLGTGNPVREAQLREGEVVLDLGCGAGVDVLLAARAVGPRGRAIGVDFTPEMVAKARANAQGWSNVAIHEAPMERLPVADASVDVVVSNCVINLSLDKAAVLREAHRALRPGGRFVVSDTLRLPWTPAQDAAGPSCDCTTGAMSASEWKRELAAAGFVDIEVRAGPPQGAVGTATIRGQKA